LLRDSSTSEGWRAQGGIAEIADLLAGAQHWLQAEVILHDSRLVTRKMTYIEKADENGYGAQTLVQVGNCDDQSAVLSSESVAFRCSCVRDGKEHKGFKSVQVMQGMGNGTLRAHCDSPVPWHVALYSYDVEVLGFFSEDTFACGLVLGGEWRTNRNPKERDFGAVPFGLGERRTFMRHTVWYNSKLRPSTALLMLTLAKVQPGDTVVDPMGGVGTIAIEAATRWSNVRALTGDNNRVTSWAAIKNCQLARDGHLAPGSSVNALDWDARQLSNLETSSVDKCVCDLPFNNRTDWDASRQLPAVLSEMGRILKPGRKSRCVLLMQGYRRILKLLDAENVQACYHGLHLVEQRTVGIGGFIAYILVLGKPQMRKAVAC